MFVRILLLGGILILLVKMVELIQYALSKSYREKIKKEKVLKRKIKETIEKLKNIKSPSEIKEIIYDAYENDFNINEFEKYKNLLTDFTNEKNIINLIFGAYYTEQIFNLETSFKLLIKNNLSNNSTDIYLSIIREIIKSDRRENIRKDNFHKYFKNKILYRLLNRRKNLLEYHISSKKNNLNNKLIAFKENHQIKEETFSFVNITNKINYKEGYNEFVYQFINENKELESLIKQIIKKEIIEDTIIDLKTEIQNYKL